MSYQLETVNHSIRMPTCKWVGWVWNTDGTANLIRFQMLRIVVIIGLDLHAIVDNGINVEPVYKVV